MEEEDYVAPSPEIVMECVNTKGLEDSTEWDYSGCFKYFLNIWGIGMPNNWQNVDLKLISICLGVFLSQL